MSTTTLPRLPRELLSGGASVAVRLPLESGAVAHKPERSSRVVQSPVGWHDQKELVTFAACAPDDDVCREFTASWADHMGVQACTEPACFPDAEPR